jgi:hypothetical protein
MWHILHLIARPIEALLGLFCVMTAILLYPDQEGKIQSKLEDFWVRVDDFQNQALTRHVAFMSEIAKLEMRLLNALFGEKLFSFQSMGTSFICSTASVMIVRMFRHSSVFHTQAFGQWEKIAILTFSLIVMGILSLLLVSKSGWLSNFGKWLGIVTLSLVAGVILFVAFESILRMWRFFQIRPLTFAAFVKASILIDTQISYTLVFSYLCDLIFIIVTRVLIRRTSEMSSVSKMMLPLLATLGLALILVSPMLIAKPLGNRFSENATGTVYLVGASNLFDVALALLFGFMVCILLVHSAVWPLLTRTLFRMQDIGTKGRRGILTAVGLALLGTSVFGGKFPELVKDLIKLFGG